MNRSNRNSKQRHGLSSVLAMLYLVLFSTLAVGFAAATSMNSQISRNERALQQADSAADGGMQFVRYQLGAMTIPPNTPTNQILTAAATSLAVQLNGTSNMNGHTVQVSTDSSGNSCIFLPSATSWTTIDPSVGTQFRAKIIQSGAFLITTVDGAGTNSSIKKALQMKFQLAPKAGAILDYGVATQGTLATGGATVIQGLTDPTKGSVLSANMTSGTPIVIDGKEVSGDISIVNPSGNISVSGAEVGMTTNPALILTHEHVGVPAPTFPVIDTTAFTNYVDTTNPANAYTGNQICTNCYIPAGANPTFTNGQINGVMVVLTPNKISFTGNSTITGVIVGVNGQTFDATANKISFAGNVSATPIGSMTSSSTGYEPGMNQLTGSFMLAPAFAVNMTGNFGTIGGSIAAGSLSMTGNAQGTVQGSVIGMQDVPMTLNGNSSITISSTGTTDFPTGMNFGNDYTPLPGTYIEVTPW
jgi:Tfp pilus assembly protein PilX